MHQDTKSNKAFKALAKHITSRIKHHKVAAVSTVSFVVITISVFLFVSPLVIHSLFPQYDIVKKYTVIGVCTDVTATNSAVFLPISCASIVHSSTIGCISTSVSHYIAPAISTDDQKTLCPTLISKTDSTGTKNIALAVLPIDEVELKLIVTITTIFGLILIYGSIYLIKRRAKVAQK